MRRALVVLFFFPSLVAQAKGPPAAPPPAAEPLPDPKELVEAVRLSIRDMSPSFRPGPYTTIKVDATDPERIALGTSDGYVAFSPQGGADAQESQVVSARQYIIMTLRGNNSKTRSYSGVRNAFTIPPGRLFFVLLNAGMPTGHWQSWQAINDVPTDIIDLSLPADPSTPMLVGAATGVYTGDLRRGVWTRVIGSHRLKDKSTPGFAVAVDPQEPHHMLASTSEGVFVSLDGGANFSRHRGFAEDARVTQFQWSRESPDRVIAIVQNQVMMSDDRGQTFNAAFAAPDSINQLTVAQDGIYAGTASGVFIQDDKNRTETRLAGQNVVGVVPLGIIKAALVATSRELFLTAPGASRRLKIAADHEDFIALVGTPAVAWALTRTQVLRISAAEPRTVKRSRQPLVMRMDLPEVEAQVRRHMGFGGPESTRLYDRWYAKVIPRIMLRFKGMLTHDYSLSRDLSLPLKPFDFWSTGTSSSCCGTIVGEPAVAMMVHASWSPSKFTGYGVSNPYAFIESGLRSERERIFGEIRWRYRALAHLVRLFAFPPADEVQALLWRFRLEEYSSYLQQLCGCTVVDMPTEERTDDG